MAEVGAALPQEPRGEPADEYAHRDVDEEDPRPAEGTGQRAAEQHACGAAAARGRSPDTEREVALPAFPKGGGQNRKRRRRQQCCSETLERTEADQRAFRPGKAVEQRADGEQGESGQEQAPPPEQVGEATA